MANERFDPLGTLPANLNDQEAHEPYYEDSRAMVLSHYVMAERCLQVEATKIYNDFNEGDYSTLTYILEGGFRGFHKYTKQEQRDEWLDGAEDKWFQLYADGELPWEPYEEDPICQVKC